VGNGRREDQEENHNTHGDCVSIEMKDLMMVALESRKSQESNTHTHTHTLIKPAHRTQYALKNE
jgi:hypothetical protein